MKSQIIGLTDWLKTPPGAYLLDWEQTHFDQAVSDIFGYHALQLGLPELDALQANRMPHQWLALTGASPTRLDERVAHSISSRPVALMTDPAALPFAENSLDLVLLPHTYLINDHRQSRREVLGPPPPGPFPPARSCTSRRPCPA